MISVAEALAAAADRIPERVRIDESTLSDEDRRRLDYIDATVDSLLFKHFVGDAVAVPVPVNMNGHLLATDASIAALKQRYESAEGGWSVGVFPQPDQGTYNLIFSAPKAAIVKSALPKLTQEVTTTQANVVELRGVRIAPRILVRMPTRGRAAQALEVMGLYRSLAGCPIKMEIVVDEDDSDTLRAEVLQRFAAMGCTVTVGRHASKVEACNGGRVTGWDVLVLASDDMWPVVDGWAVRVLEEMEKHWPMLDGALHFNDGFQRANLCTLPVMGRRLWEQFDRQVYDESYKSLYCDKEYTDVFKALGRLTYVDEKIIEHRHHAWNRAVVDETYARNDALESADKLTYEARKIHAIQMPILSILICSVPRRRALLERLFDDLHTQIVAPNIATLVEICVDMREDVTVGEKRQALLERAHSAYVAFIDDDDGVAHDYVRRVFQAIVSNRGVDCVSLVGTITTDGRNPQRFEHSIKHEKWETVGGVHLRSTNHLNAVKRELALKVGFVSKNVGEDFDYATRLRPLLVTEASAGDEPLYYYWYSSRDTVQSKGK